ncbi:MAG: hypothetical protein IKN06_00800, partial [Bacteroidales bacterium]|nr:hypothetical protein [Bacteroidales bacterium]
MKHVLLSLAILALAGSSLHAQDSFHVRVDQPQHGKVTVTPAIPESGLVPAGTVLKVKVDVTDPGWVFDSGYELSVSGGVFYPTYKESMVPEFTV